MQDANKKGHTLAKRLRSDMPNAEYCLWQEIRRKQIAGQHFRRQLPIGPYVVDFACVKEKLIVEVDGVGHSSEKDIFKDKKRTAFLSNKGWRVLRFWNEEIYEDVGSVVEAISGHLSTATEAEKNDK